MALDAWFTGGDLGVADDILRELSRLDRGKRKELVIVQPSGAFFVKRYVHQRLLEQIWARYKVFLGKSRSGNEFRNLRLLFSRGVPVADPLAYADRVSSIRCLESLVISRFLPSARLAKHALRDEHERNARLAIIHALAEVVAKLHSENLSHGDLHLGNVMITQSGERTTCHLIDCGINARATRRYRVEDDLAQIMFSGRHVADWSDWRTFLRRYREFYRRKTDKQHLRKSLLRLSRLYSVKSSKP